MNQSEVAVARMPALRRANRELQDMIATLAKAREDLVRNEKLAGLGALVAGIAHELNTPIGSRSEGLIAVSAQLSSQGWVTLSVEDHGAADQDWD